VVVESAEEKVREARRCRLSFARLAPGPLPGQLSLEAAQWHTLQRDPFGANPGRYSESEAESFCGELLVSLSVEPVFDSAELRKDPDAARRRREEVFNKATPEAIQSVASIASSRMISPTSPRRQGSADGNRGNHSASWRPEPDEVERLLGAGGSGIGMGDVQSELNLGCVSNVASSSSGSHERSRAGGSTSAGANAGTDAL
jgi:hypothetical protein